MRIYHSAVADTCEEIVTQAIAYALYIIEPQLLEAASMPPIRDIYTVGTSMFIHFDNGDLYNVAIQRMTPDLDSNTLPEE